MKRALPLVVLSVLVLAACEKAGQKKAQGVVADVKAEAAGAVHEAGDIAKAGGAEAKKDVGELAHDAGGAIKEGALDIKDGAVKGGKVVGAEVKKGAKATGNALKDVGSRVKDAVNGDSEKK